MARHPAECQFPPAADERCQGQAARKQPKVSTCARSLKQESIKNNSEVQVIHINLARPCAKNHGFRQKSHLQI